MLRHLGKLLETFPFSKLSQRGPTVRVYALRYAETPVLERPFDPGADIGQMIAAARDFAQPDCCVEIDAAWDLWQYDGEWKVLPSAVTISCFGSGFENELDDHLRIDFGLDATFLPSPEIEGSLKIRQSNLRSLLYLGTQIEQALPLERRQLWSESGANFAAVLEETVSRLSVN
jgi:hypothetical protein